MIVEFFGLPASGKTRIARQMEAEAGFKIVSIDKKGELLLLNVLFIAKHPFFSFLTIVYILKEGGGASLIYTKLMNAFLHHNAKYEKARTMDRAIIDQGHLQNVIILFERQRASEFLTRYINMMPRPDVCVAFHADVDVMRERMHRRGRGIRGSLKEADIRTWEAVAQAHFEAAKRHIKTICLVSEIQANKSADEVFENVHRLVKRLGNTLRVCMFGFYRPEYSRNRVIQKGLVENGVHIFECRSTKKGISKYIELIRLHGRLSNRYDILFAAYPGYLTTPLARIISRGPIVFDAFFSIYDSVVNDRKTVSAKSAAGVYFWLLDWLAIRAANLVLLDTYAHIDYFVRTFRAPREKLRRILVGSDDAVMRPAASPVPEQAGYGTRTDDARCLVHFHGGYNPMQGAAIIVEAAKNLENTSIVFRMIGRGQELAKIRSFAVKSGLTNIKFIPHFVSYEELARYIQESSLCLGIFSGEEKARRVIPNKVYEALASKKAVITADTPAIRELLEPGTHSLCIAPDDPDALAQAIKSLCNNRERRERIAEAGYALFRERCTPRVLGKELLHIIHETLS